MKDDIYTEFNMLENEVFDWVLKKKKSPERQVRIDLKII